MLLVLPTKGSPEAEQYGIRHVAKGGWVEELPIGQEKDARVLLEGRKDRGQPECTLECKVVRRRISVGEWENVEAPAKEGDVIQDPNGLPVGSVVLLTRDGSVCVRYDPGWFGVGSREVGAVRLTCYRDPQWKVLHIPAS
jgi:hypothetical protein